MNTLFFESSVRVPIFKIYMHMYIIRISYVFHIKFYYFGINDPHPISLEIFHKLSSDAGFVLRSLLTFNTAWMRARQL